MAPHLLNPKWIQATATELVVLSPRSSPTGLPRAFVKIPKPVEAEEQRLSGGESSPRQSKGY